MKSWSSLVRTTLLPLCLFTASTIACSSTEEPNDNGNTTIDFAPALENYATHLQKAYADSAADARVLKTKLEALIATPSQATLDAARTEWLNSRRHYMLTEGARFYEGPIDSETAIAGETIGNVEYLLNGWPLDEAYIDYVTDGGPTREPGTPGEGGIIANPNEALTPENLDGLNGEGGEENVAAGYHAIEFVLWGQAMDDVGPGQRPFTDFDPNDSTHGATAKRRGEFLIAAIDGIIKHLDNLANAWKDGAPYRAEFLTNKDNQSVANVLSGFGKLSRGEMAGERINAGLESKARRDQHNCFSSTTFADYIRDAEGILAFYKGDYDGHDGPGFDELVGASDAAVGKRILEELNTTITDLKGMTVPFEEAIQGDDASPPPARAALIKIREDFRTQGASFADAAKALGISLTIPDEN